VRGELDEAASSELTRILDNRLGAPGVSRVLVDLIGVATLTSAGVCVLHRLHRDCRVRDLHLVLVGTANPAVHRLLYLSGLLPLVDARPTVQAALRGAHFPPSAHPVSRRAARRGRPGRFRNAVAVSRSPRAGCEFITIA
jgi:anti-anti-sigma factor